MTSTMNKAEPKTMPRRQQIYREKVVEALRKEFGYPNPMMVPRLQKIVVNMGVGRAVENKNRIESANKDLTAIVGQKPMIRKARGAVSGFKLREGYPIGVAVTTMSSPNPRRSHSAWNATSNFGVWIAVILACALATPST